MKLIARIFAETGIRDLFALLHGCIRKNDKQANTVGCATNGFGRSAQLENPRRHDDQCRAGDGSQGRAVRRT
jgi:hypothetical protein